MKIIFFGTPDYVLPILDKLDKHYEIVAIVTQEPKPVGRDQKLEYSAVDTWAHKREIHKQFDFKYLPEADLGVCASFGKIIPREVTEMFKYGIINIHPSLLPQYRGATPIPSAMIDGFNPTGVSIIKMDEKMDHGPILTQFKEEILETDTAESLRKRLFEKSAQVLIEMIPAYVKGKIKLKKQDDSKATYTKMLTKESGYLDFELIKNASELNNNPDFDAGKINRFVKAMKPWPVAWTKIIINGKESRLKLISSHINNESGYLELDEVQLEGKNPVSWKQFKQAYTNLKN